MTPADAFLEAIAERVAAIVLERMTASQKPAPAPAEWMTRKQAAKLLGMHEDSVRRLSGLPTHRIGRRVRYCRAEVESFLRSGGAR